MSVSLHRVTFDKDRNNNNNNNNNMPTLSLHQGGVVMPRAH